MITIIVVLALLTQPLTAAWERPGVARVSWSGAGCLFHNETLYRCYDAGQTLLLGDRGPIDYAYRPAPGDTLRLVRPGGAVEVARLGSVWYFPVWRG